MERLLRSDRYIFRLAAILIIPALLVGFSKSRAAAQAFTPVPPTTVFQSTPAATPTPGPSGSCITLLSPPPNSAFSPGTIVPFVTIDGCLNNWFETLYVDNIWVGDFDTGEVTLQTSSYAIGAHTVTVTSQSQNPGSTELGSVSETIIIGGASTTPTPTPSPTPTPIPESSASACITITSPSNNAIEPAGSSIPITVTDNCPGMWFESLYVDLQHIKDFPLGAVVWTIPSNALGNYTVTVTSQTQNPGSAILDAASITIDVSSADPTATSTATGGSTSVPAMASSSPTPTPGDPVSHFAMLPSDAALPSGDTCASEVNATPIKEVVSANQDDGTGFSMNGIVKTPSYFYQHAGEQIVFPNADFQRVDGNYSGTTDMILRWAACKWGVDENWVRADTETEMSGWNSSCSAMHGGSDCHQAGDNNTPDGSCSGVTPGLSHDGWQVTDSAGNVVAAWAVPGYGSYSTWSIIQSKTMCAEWYTWPMLALSNSWGEDYRWAKFRSCMNGSARFNASDYRDAVNRAHSDPDSQVTGETGELFFKNETNLQYLAAGCLAAHFSGAWYDSGASSYFQDFQKHLNSSDWPGGLHN